MRCDEDHQYAGSTCQRCGVDHADPWAKKPCPGKTAADRLFGGCCWRGAFSREECSSRGGPDDCAMHSGEWTFTARCA